MPIEQLVRRLADNKQYFTMHGGMRPYGVSVLYAGWDKHLGYQLYCVSDRTESPRRISYHYKGSNGRILGWPLRQLRWVQGHLYWEQCPVGVEYAGAGLQGGKIYIFIIII